MGSPNDYILCVGEVRTQYYESYTKKGPRYGSKYPNVVLYTREPCTPLLYAARQERNRQCLIY